MYNDTEKVSQNVVTTSKPGGAKKGKESPGGAPPQQPGVMMWNAGIIYFAENFTAETTKPVINTIIEKNLMPNSERPNEITLVINSPGGSVHAAFALIEWTRSFVASGFPWSLMGSVFAVHLGSL